MPSLGDMAGSEAAARKLAELGGGAGGLPPELADMGAMAPPEEAGMGDPEMLIDQLVASFEGAPEDVANEARMHLNAVRELLAQGAAAEEPVPAEEGAAPSEAPAELPKEMEA